MRWLFLLREVRFQSVARTAVTSVVVVTARTVEVSARTVAITTRATVAVAARTITTRTGLTLYVTFRFLGKSTH